ncbi:MAG: chemotaxis protein CheR [Bacillales bacterium]|jgi:chemotaxis protein methyltransferase CheR|nr:chemotaxis protein CheR [Bacillales bacterium]
MTELISKGETEMVDNEFSNFIVNVKKKTGIDLSKYKEDQMKRRLTTLYIKNGFANFDQYFKSIQIDSKMYLEFLNQITINVTEFYRNPSLWEVLKNEIIPQYLNEKRKITCWSSACSTGEEPYTLAMIFHELGITNYEIVASDLDEVVLSKAQLGIYGERSLKDLPKKYIDTYLDKKDSVFQISNTIKRNVKFKKLDLLHDAFDSNYDLIICRNVMIYFTEEANNYLYQKLSDALRTGGVLFVGSTEQIFRPEKYNLEMVGSFFYRKK